MKEKRRLFQPLNLIVFLLFVLAAEVTVCLPLFEDANALLQIAWTGYLLLGMGFLFFIGGKIAAGRNVDKYLGHSEKGKFWLGLLLFFVCFGAGTAFQMREIVANSGTLSTIASLNLLFYIEISFITYLIVKQVSGFGGAAAVAIFLTLCPLFDFNAEFSLVNCLYTVLFLGAILSVSLAKHSLEVREPCWRDFLLTILGALALAGATFLHISAVAALLPCMFFLIRKGEPQKKEKGRIERCFLFAAMYACITAVIYILSVYLQNAWTLEFPVDYELLHALKAIIREPENALIALFEKLSSLFTVDEQGEYYNGLLMGMLFLGLIRAILLFNNKIEKHYFPVYLFNWYLLICILLDEFISGKVLLFILLACAAAGTMADLAGAIIARKQRKLKAEELEEHKSLETVTNEENETGQQLPEKSEEAKKAELRAGEEGKKSEPAAGLEEGKESEVKADTETKEKPERKRKEPLPELTLEEILPGYVPKEEILKVEQENSNASNTEDKSLEGGQEALDVQEPIEGSADDITETDPAETGVLSGQMEKQIQELLNREELIIEIMEKQSVQISKLEQELKEQRMLARKRERHYRQQHAVTRNKKK